MERSAKDSWLEKKFNITSKHIKEVSEKIDNDDFSDFDVANGYIVSRSHPLEKNVVMSFVIEESGSDKIKEISRQNHMSSSAFCRAELHKVLATY